MTFEDPKGSRDQAFIAWLSAQRWYGDKSRVVAGHSRLPITRIPMQGATVAISADTVTFEDGSASTYLVTLDDATPPRDATARPGFLAWLAAGFEEGLELPASDLAGASLHWESPSELTERWTTLPARLLSGEQSNSSIIYGDAAVLKLFRKLQPGTNPDSEIVAFLTGRTGFRHVPTYLGGLVLRFDDGRDSIELAAVQGFVSNQGDCWRWLPAALLEGSAAERTALLDQVGLLGQRTGELHAALASGDDLPAFAPEYHDASEAGRVAARIRDEVAVTCNSLRAKGALTAPDADRLQHALVQRLGDGSVLAGLPRIRVHGDYHLGQVLRVGNDFVIIDFEGEPSRTMAERRQKHSPFKDVAGMLRSLDYAVSSASFSASEPDVPLLMEWGRAAEARFVDRYRAAVTASPVRLVPDDALAFTLALDLYMVDKAVYEVRYELDNRPDWLRIPLDGLQRIAQGF